MSTCVKRVLTTLKEKGLQYELIPVDMMTKREHKSEAYLEKQPFGVVPVLEDDGFIIYESRAICRYLEAKYRGQGTELIPTADVESLAIFEQGASIETSYFDGPVSGIVMERLFKPKFGGQADEARVKTLVEKLSANLDVYDKILSKQEFIGGKTFTLADLYHLPYGALLFVPSVGLGNLITDRPHVKAWWEKITSRKSWQEVIQ